MAWIPRAVLDAVEREPLALGFGVLAGSGLVPVDLRELELGRRALALRGAELDIGRDVLVYEVNDGVRFRLSALHGRTRCRRAASCRRRRAAVRSGCRRCRSSQWSGTGCTRAWCSRARRARIAAAAGRCSPAARRAGGRRPALLVGEVDLPRIAASAAQLPRRAERRRAKAPEGIAPLRRRRLIVPRVVVPIANTRVDRVRTRPHLERLAVDPQRRHDGASLTVATEAPAPASPSWFINNMNPSAPSATAPSPSGKPVSS